MNFRRIKRLLFLLRKKGVRYTYNYFWFYLLCLSNISQRWPLLNRLFFLLEPYPQTIEIETTTRCHLKCIMCEHAYWNEPDRDMSFEEFQKIVNQFPYLRWIGLTGIGESFLNKNFLKILRFLKEKLVFIEIFDTFYLIDKEIARKLIDMRIDRIFASIDGATKRTYEKIRVGSNFERVMENVKNFLRLKKDSDSEIPGLVFHYIISKENIAEILPYIELVDSIREGGKVTIQFSQMLHGFQEVRDLFIEVPEEIMQKVEERTRELGIGLIWNPNVSKTKPAITKCRAWMEPFVFVTGHVVPCCAGNEANRRQFQKEYSLGNVFEKPFRKIWYSEKYRKFRQMIAKGEVPIQCKNCCVFDTGGK